MEKQQLSSKNLILTYGLLLGVLTILISVIKYMTGNHLERTAIDSIIGIILMIALIVIPIRIYKKQNNEKLSLSESIKIGLGISAVYAVIYVLYMFVFANYIEPGFVGELMDIEMQKLEDQNMSSEQLDQAMGMMEGFMMPIMYVSILIMSLIIGLIISLITGLVLKKE